MLLQSFKLCKISSHDKCQANNYYKKETLGGELERFITSACSPKKAAAATGLLTAQSLWQNSS